MIQFYFRFKSGNFENGYFEIGNNKELALNSAITEFAKDCETQGFTPIKAILEKEEVIEI